mgnify:FL=1
MGTKLLHWADHTLHIKSRLDGSKISRVIRTIPTDTMDAGSRGKMVPDGIQWGEDDKANFQAFKQLFT